MTTHNQRMANQHENEVADAFGGHVTPMSGAGWISKGDVRSRHEYVECKATEARSYSVSLKLLQDVQRQGLLCERIGVLNIKFMPFGTRPSRWVVLSEEDYLELRAKAGDA